MTKYQFLIRGCNLIWLTRRASRAKRRWSFCGVCGPFGSCMLVVMGLAFWARRVMAVASEEEWITGSYI